MICHSPASEAKLLSFALTCAQARFERPTPPGFIDLGVAQNITAACSASSGLTLTRPSRKRA